MQDQNNSHFLIIVKSLSMIVTFEKLQNVYTCAHLFFKGNYHFNFFRIHCILQLLHLVPFVLEDCFMNISLCFKFASMFDVQKTKTVTKTLVINHLKKYIQMHIDTHKKQ